MSGYSPGQGRSLDIDGENAERDVNEEVDLEKLFLYLILIKVLSIEEAIAPYISLS